MSQTQEARYTLEIVSSITGISSETILRYQQHGLIRPRNNHFDDETLYTLRRIEHLRETSGANVSGLKLILDLLHEVETLRSSLRSHR
ncbi:MAG: chaperone modulator CbpM [Luteolibacter sp.]